MERLKSYTRRGFYRILWLGVAIMISCGDSGEPAPSPGIPVKKLAVDPATTYQTVSGFGGANQMWGTQFPDASDMQKAFGTGDDGLGLSIFRIRISSNPAEWPLIVNVTKEAISRGATILASPWSPPPALKSNGSDVGGYLPEENYEAFADHLRAFVDYMATNGAPVDVISIQNEPDIQVSYESCDWSSSAMRTFLREHGPLIDGVRIAAPESFNFNASYTNAILNDQAAADALDIVAGHIYGSGLAPFPLAQQKGKEVWMTEYLLNKNATSAWSELDDDEIWDETLVMLETMHEAMTHNWNAYIWWYLKRYYSFIGDGTQGTTSGEILKRGYAFSHFSKFVRPGYVRVKTTFNYDAGVTAYQGDGKIVIVLVNSGATTISNIGVTVGDKVPSSAVVYETTLTSNLEKSTIEAEDGELVFTLGPRSVVTVVMEN